MDPVACWNALKDCMGHGELAAAGSLAADLANWLHKGGFKPAGVPSEEALLGFASVLDALD